MNAAVWVDLPVTLQALDDLRAATTPSTAAIADEVFDALSGAIIRATRITPTEAVASYRVRGDIATAAGKRLYGHAEFVAKMERLGNSAYIGSSSISRLTFFVLFEADGRRPIAWMAIESPR